jgi:hypothetical protein
VIRTKGKTLIEIGLPAIVETSNLYHDCMLAELITTTASVRNKYKKILEGTQK